MRCVVRPPAGVLLDDKSPSVRVGVRENNGPV